MPALRRKLPFWMRTNPAARFDIARLRPSTLPKGKRFETLSDVGNESARSQDVLSKYGEGEAYALYLEECRNGYYHCEKTFCPLCARTFRRCFTGELLRLNSEYDGAVRVLVVLLKIAPKGNLQQLQIEPYRHSLRKRLERAGLESPIGDL
jgi:hypothetical protein